MNNGAQCSTFANELDPLPHTRDDEWDALPFGFDDEFDPFPLTPPRPQNKLSIMSPEVRWHGAGDDRPAHQLYASPVRRHRTVAGQVCMPVVQHEHSAADAETPDDPTHNHRKRSRRLACLLGISSASNILKGTAHVELDSDGAGESIGWFVCSCCWELLMGVVLFPLCGRAWFVELQRACARSTDGTHMGPCGATRHSVVRVLQW